ncbi:MAG: N-succinyldiaminopimelate aminotransferase [Pseudonocardiales bacterium]|nr:N-succinyldiaminopimelate aminotransferase [Pseudonocardiales bacterium]
MRGFGTTIFAEMSALALATDSVNLGQGFPDTDGPPEILAAAVDAMRSGQNQYPPGPGIPALRLAIAEHQQRCYGLDYHPDAEVLVTAGATEAIAAAVLALAGPGDEVVLFEPYYDSYAACIALGGATRRTVTIERDGAGWGFDPAALERAITPATKLILLNSPHNPTGTVFGPAELAVIADAAIRHDLVVISDEVYEHLTFDGHRHVPIATLPGMRERTVTISSAGKTFSVTGWKIGWACAPPPLLAAVRTVKQFLTYVNGAPFQPAVAQVLATAEKLAPADALQAQRDLLCDGLAERGYDVIRPQATYFATVDVGTDAVAFCRDLPRRAGVVAIPSSVFYDSGAGDHYVRFAFCKRPDVLAEALRRLADGRFAGEGAGR